MRGTPYGPVIGGAPDSGTSFQELPSLLTAIHWRPREFPDSRQFLGPFTSILGLGLRPEKERQPAALPKKRSQERWHDSQCNMEENKHGGLKVLHELDSCEECWRRARAIGNGRGSWVAREDCQALGRSRRWCRVLVTSCWDRWKVPREWSVNVDRRH